MPSNRKIYGVGPDGALSECRAKNPETCRFHVPGSHKELTQRQFEKANEALIRQDMTPVGLRKTVDGEGSGGSSRWSVSLGSIKTIGPTREDVLAYVTGNAPGTKDEWCRVDYDPLDHDGQMDVYVNLPATDEDYSIDGRTPEVSHLPNGGHRLRIYGTSIDYGMAAVNGSTAGTAMIEERLDPTRPLEEQLVHAGDVTEDPSALLGKMRGGAGWPAYSGDRGVHLFDAVRSYRSYPDPTDGGAMIAEVENEDEGLVRRFKMQDEDPAPMWSLAQSYLADAEPGQWRDLTRRESTGERSYVVRPDGSSDVMVEVSEDADGQWRVYSYGSVDGLVTAVCADTHDGLGLWTETAELDEDGRPVGYGSAEQAMVDVCEKAGIRVTSVQSA